MRFVILILILFSSIIVYGEHGKKKKKPQPTLALADSLFLSSNWEATIPIYEVVLKSKPENSLAWIRLGFCCHNLSDYDKAVVNYLKSLDHKPNVPLETIVQSRLARIYSIRNESDKAFQSLYKTLQLGYRNFSELDTQKEFDNIRSDGRFTDVIKRANFNVFQCMGNAQAREFDFWIGEWDAFVTGTNDLAGHSRIDMASGGCMILENWTSVGGPFEGKSMNFVDPTSGKWKQIWVGSGSLPNATEFFNGEYREDAMRFEFETTNTQGGKQLVHFYFYNQGPDQIRQLHETSNDGGTTWTTTYDFTYKRKK